MTRHLYHAHLRLSMLVILGYLLVIFALQLRWDAGRGLLFFLANFLQGYIIYVFLLIIFVMPLFVAVYFAYKLLIKDIFLNFLLAPLLILSGGFLCPLIFFPLLTSGGSQDWGWVLLWILVPGNVLVIIANELLLAYQLSKLKNN